jgi:hypothetical protein
MTRRHNGGRPPRAACSWGLAIGLAALAAAACDKMPLSAPSESVITLYSSSSSVGSNGALDVVATVIEAAGTPVQNGTVVTFLTTLGAMDPVEARTNNGKATAKFLPGNRSGVAEISAFSGGIATTAALKISVGAAAAGKVDLIANPAALPATGGTVQLTAIVSDASGNRLAGVPVSFTSDAGIMSQNSVTTDGNGEARTSLSTTVKTKVTALVVGGSGSSTSLTASVDIAVRVGPTVTISAPSASLVPGVPATFSVTVTAGGSAVRAATIDFGDGAQQAVSVSGTSTAQHAYRSSGTYIITAIATDVAGEVGTATSSVAVQEVVVAVTLSVSPAQITTATQVIFTATATSNPTGAQIERYEWTFGDGSTRTTTGPSTSHQYAAAGRYVAVVRAYTTQGASGTGQVDFVVQ